MTNQFRAAGGGGFDKYREDSVASRSPVTMADALSDALTHPEDQVWPDHTPWSFETPTPVQAVLQTAPAAFEWLAEIALLSPEPLGTDPEGFARIRLTL